MSHFRKLALACAVPFILVGCATGPGKKSSSTEQSEMYSAMGTEALLRGDLAQAITDLRHAIEINSKNSIAHNHLGLALYGLGRREEAIANYRRALAIDPAYSDAHINLGMSYFQEAKLTPAKAEFKRALDNVEYKYRHRALTNLAQISLAEGRLEEARTYLYESLSVNPDYCMTHFLFGTLHLRESDPQKATESFRKSVRSTCVSSAEGHLQLGIAYSKSKDYEKARQTFALVVEKFPESDQAKRAGEQLRSMP